MTVKIKKCIAELISVAAFVLAFCICGGISDERIALSMTAVLYIVILLASGAAAAYKAGWMTKN